MARKVHAAVFIRDAKKQGIGLLEFPETFVPGYPYFIECYPPIKQVGALAEYAEQSVTVQSDLRDVQSACREAKVSICLGVSERVPDGFTLFNSQVYIDAQGQIKRRTYDTLGDFKIGGLCCWENTMPLARQALTVDGEEIHVGAWPALNTMAGFESVADAQIKALMKNHDLTGQTFVLCASNYVDETCLTWMKEKLGEQDSMKAGGGWSAIIHPFCIFLAGPFEQPKDHLVSAELDPSQLGQFKVWIDSSGHYRRPEVFGFKVNRKPLWADDAESANWPAGEEDQALRRRVEDVHDKDSPYPTPKADQ